MKVKFLPVLFCFALSHALSEAGQIRINANYRLQNLLISVQDENFVTADNVRKLQAWLAAFSYATAFATEPVGRRISLETARLLVPDSKVAELTAAGFSISTATWESELAADLRLVSTGEAQVKTIPADECYGPNRFIQMRDYLISTNATANDLLREFAIYRWGVLSERNDTSGAFYQDEGSFLPAICTANTPGSYAIRGSNPIRVSSTIKDCRDELTGREVEISAAEMEKVCEFTEQSEGAETRASILALRVARFCDNATASSPIRHNDRLPNPQNRLCNRQSAGEVLRRHADFSTSLAGTSTTDTLSTLLLVSASAIRNIVLVLDTSGSMIGSRIQNLIRSATIYIKYFVETNARVSIVIFNETVTVWHPMENLTDDAVRDRVASAVQKLVAQGYTNIGDALLKAMEILGATTPYNKAQTGFVVLITDGENNRGDLDAAIADVVKTSIVVDTVCISSAADSRMAKLADLTGGLSIFVSAVTPVNIELEVAFAKLAERSPGSKRKSVLLHGSTTALPVAGGTVQVGDTSILYFMVSLPNVNLNSVDFTATNPSGVVYGRSKAGVYAVNTAISTITITIPAAEIVNGTWSWNLTSVNVVNRKKRSPNEETEFLVRRARSTSTGTIVVVGDSSATLSLESWLRYTSFPKVTQSTIQKIYAYITNNGAPVTGANVVATIVPANSSAFTLALKDDGLGSDLTANDGIYVAQILPEQMTSVGDYGVTVVMTSPFSRVTTPGKFRVESLASGVVTVPPGRVADLRVLSSWKQQNFTVEFASPGNQEYEGTPAAYEIRAANSFDQLAMSFSTSPLIARPLGQPAGSMVRVQLQAADLAAVGLQTNVTFFVSAAAVSTTNQIGQASFPIGSSLAYSPLPSTTVATTTTTSNSLPGRERNEETTPKVAAKPPDMDHFSEWTLGLTVAAAVLATFIAAEIVALVFVALKY